MGIARSTFYDRPDTGADDATVVAQMKSICDEFETYGYRRVDAELRTLGHQAAGQVNPPAEGSA